MEDALVQYTNPWSEKENATVLILVLMEDALVPTNKVFDDIYTCLNPCFNGRCTSTTFPCGIVSDMSVLILVLMEDALVPFSIRDQTGGHNVLILVLMEDALVR